MHPILMNYNLWVFKNIYMASAIYVYPLQKVISHNMFLKLYCFIFFV